MTAASDLEPLDPLDPPPPALAAATPARVFLGRVGTTLRTRDMLALRVDHAAARDAVHARLDDESAALEPLVTSRGMFTVATQAATSHAYLRRPDLGRRFSPEGAARIRPRAPGSRPSSSSSLTGCRPAPSAATHPPLSRRSRRSARRTAGSWAGRSRSGMPASA